MYLDACIGHTPLVKARRMVLAPSSEVWFKLEGNNPAGSVKDRPAFNMIARAEARGEIKPGDSLIEATSGNTGIALAMVAAMKGYRMILIMPETMTLERRASMAAYGAELVLVSAQQGMEGARDLAVQMEREGLGKQLNQFANPDNWQAHYQTTGPEIWQQTQGKVTHFVSAMGTTGTIMGVSRYLKEMNPQIQIVGVQPTEGSQIAGIRKWPTAYLPQIFEPARVDQIREVSATRAQETMRRMAKEEGVFAGVSSGGALSIALDIAHEQPHAKIVTIVCDRGDRYLSTGLFNPES
jgi:cysteine synthase B